MKRAAIASTIIALILPVCAFAAGEDTGTGMTEQAFAGLARQILEDGATHERMRELETADGPRFDPELWRRLADAGLLGIAIPESEGGAGLGFFELALLVEQVGRSAAPTEAPPTAPAAKGPSDRRRETGKVAMSGAVSGAVTGHDIILRCSVSTCLARSAQASASARAMVARSSSLPLCVSGTA